MRPSRVATALYYGIKKLQQDWIGRSTGAEVDFYIGDPAGFEAWKAARAPDVSPEVLALALSLWGQVHGLVMLELGNQFPPFITNAGALYERELERLIQIHMPTD